MSLRTRAVLLLSMFTIAIAATAFAQDKAAVQTTGSSPFHSGGPIVFNLKLNEPLPKGARFDFRICPVSADEEVPLGPGEPINNERTEFRIAGTLPDGALPGDWHISVIWLFLPGSGWTHNQIVPNDLRFKVEGKPYSIPTTAQVTVAH